MEPKKYTMRVIPNPVPPVAKDDQGNSIAPKVIYLKKTKNTEKRSLNNIAQNEYYQVELYEQAENPFHSNPKPYTLNVFKNSNPGWFDFIADLLEDKSMHTVSPSNYTATLKEVLPGLVADVPTGFKYYATVMNKETGAETILKSNQRNRKTGDYSMEAVVINKVTFFMTKSQVDQSEKDFEETKAMVAQPEIDRARFWSLDQAVSTEEEKATAEVEEAGEVKKAA